MQDKQISPDARIVVIGAGAGGLCAAWYLKLAGFKHVQVLEKSPRIGGKCRSLTVDGQSFDLGANYITSAYKRVRALAAHVDAEMYTEKAGHVIDVKTGSTRSILSEVLRNTSIFTLAWQALRYAIKRWQLRKLLTPAAPGFAHVKDHPELQGDFDSWLKNNQLDVLIPIFEIPLTLMGYGQLKNIATVYALTYMNLGSFKDLGMFAANLPLRCWPKRFKQGYGRMFERLAAEVDVLTGVEITQITREEDIKKGITVEYCLLEQQLEGKKWIPMEAKYDYLILACPQVPVVLESLKMKLSEKEQALFEQVRFNPFFVTTYMAPDTEDVSAVSFSFPKPNKGDPYVVTRQYEDNDFISIYSRGDYKRTIDRKKVEANNQSFLRTIGAKDPTVPAFSSDDWAYFPHVTPAAVDAGFYTELEALQGGDNHTFYCGGLLAFELVETIAEHAHFLVETHFVGRSN